ncbi:uncharacterized protein LOC141914149 [Tubulanus polymorphus]|uniref:uncharacterized protein LOC141914149 n=1 Tax=Tubulanus polymorphus TaxID=672921 RepID=UPI003DA4B613
MRDMCDGTYFKNHPLLKKNPNALCLLAYCDDFELANPIGTHAKLHKIIIFYVVVCNIPPELRSKLPVIHLVAVTLRKYIVGHRDRLQKLLKNFVDDLNTLYDGYTFILPSGIYRTNGTLLAFTGDTPAANEIAGFKEGVGGASKPCRLCDIHKNDMNAIFCPSDCMMREEVEHRERCNYLKELSRADRLLMSSEYGINNDSVLQGINDFQITKCFPMDVMHVLLEGICNYETKLCLRHMVSDKNMNVSVLNNCIANYSYSELEMKDRPQPIDRKTLFGNGKLNQTSESMRILMYHLPFILNAMNILDDRDEYWSNWIRLQKITILSLSPIISDETIAFIDILVAVHNRKFVEIYPDESYTPKLHYMVHLGDQMRKYGPLRTHWCMRFEGKHGFFKKMKWNNFKNIALVIATKHQQWLCLQQLGTDGQRSMRFLNDEDDIKFGHIMHEDEDHFNDIMTYLVRETHRLQIGPLMISPKIVVHGHIYMPDNILLLEFDEDEYPVFCKITKIVVVQEEKYLLLDRFLVERYDYTLNAYELREDHSCSRNKILSVQDLQFPWVLPQKCFGYKRYVLLCYSPLVML